MALKMLKIDLCYGPIDCIGRTFLGFNRWVSFHPIFHDFSTIAVIVIQIMSDIPVLLEVANLSHEILAKKAWLHLALMQRDGIRRTPSEREEVE